MSTFARNWPGLGRDIVLNVVVASILFPRSLRWRALRAYGMRVEPSTISPGVWFGGRRVSIGEGTFINYGCMLDASAPITIGKRCSVAMQVLFATSSHEVGTSAKRAGAPTAAPIVVGDGCWIGARAVLLPGITIGPGTIVAAGSVVTADCDPQSTYAGVPARKVRSLSEGVSDDASVNAE